VSKLAHLVFDDENFVAVGGKPTRREKSVKRTSFVLVPVPPFRLDLTVWALRRRPANQIDCWDGNMFRRVLEIDHEPAEVAVQQNGNADKPSLFVTITAHSLSSSAQKEVKNQLERMLGLRQELSSFYRRAKQDPKIAPLVEEFRGLKPPRFPTVFEAVANGIACQQLSLLVGILLLSRLAGKYGQTIASSNLRSFPSPEDLFGARFNSLKALGFSGHKAEFLLAIAANERQGNLDLEKLECCDNQAALEILESLPGIGRWTAEYVLLRGLGRLNVFPGDDVGARNNLARFLGRRKPLDYEGVRRAVAKWQPYAGFIYFHLLLARIRDAGWLSNGERVESAGFRRDAA
jgi:DNA-3-methyladenine glycosylase II